MRVFLWLWPLLWPSSSAQRMFQCDRVFDEPRGEFSFPLLPKTPTEHEAEGEETQPNNLQCVYSFVAGQGQRVKLEFDYFQLAGGSESCDVEYVDVYSELTSVESDLLSASLAGRYCGSVAPQVVISLHRVLVLVFHSRSRDGSRRFRFSGRYSFTPDAKYQPGAKLPGPCSFLLDPHKKKRGVIHSPTYPGSYPKNFHCSYLLKGKTGQRIRLLFRDFDIYFGGEHCPYDSVTVFDGSSPSSPIIRKVCGLQQRMEMFSVGPDLLIHFNTTNPAKADPRGFVIEYEFSSRFVDVSHLLAGERGVTHMRGSECDVRVESNRETTHHIHSPGYPNMYPANTTCSYILDGLQGDQNLEKVIVTFQDLAVLSDSDGVPSQDSNPDDVTCPYAWVGVAVTEGNMKAALSSTDDSNFDTTLCDRIPQKSPLLGPYVSAGPRMVIQFGTADQLTSDGMTPIGFRAKVEFKTDFGITGEPMGTSNECLFRFQGESGFFNSPRYPANYPLDTNCTYFIEGKPGQQILIHFEQFALFGEKEEDKCKDWLEIYDVFRDDSGTETLRLQERYCSDTFPGPTVSAFGAHAIRVVFCSDSSGTGNGFKALYEIRKAMSEDIPSIDRSDSRAEGPLRCGRRIVASDEHPTGFVMSPNYPIKYNKDVHCDWEIKAREGHEILLNMVKMEVEGEMTASSASCQKAVIRVSGAPRSEYCGTDQSIFLPFLTANNTVRISFLTSPDKVNGLKGFNMSWTEVRQVKDASECSSGDQYLCTYSQLCISAQLRCNGDANCGHHDDTDEGHCAISRRLALFFTKKTAASIGPLMSLLVYTGELKQSSTDKTIVVAGVFCGGIFVFICAFFCFLFKKKLERKKKKEQSSNGHRRARQPYRSHQPKTSHLSEAELASPATSRFVHHDATGILPPQVLRPIAEQTFFG